MLASIYRPLRNLSIGSKLTLLSLSLLLPLAVLLYFTVTTMNASIAFAEFERAGVAHLRPLQTLTAAVPRHRAAAYHTLTDSDASLRGDLTQIGRRVDAALAALQVASQEHGPLIGVDPPSLQAEGLGDLTPSRLAEQWQAVEQDLELALRDRSERSIDAAMGSYERLIESVDAAISHIGDRSKLVLDPDLDSYYLMDVVVFSLPEMQRHLGETALTAERSVADGSLSPDESIAMAVDAELIRMQTERVVGSVETAAQEDANFYGRSDTIAGVTAAATSLAGAGLPLADEIDAVVADAFAADADAGDNAVVDPAEDDGPAQDAADQAGALAAEAERLRELVARTVAEASDLGEIAASELDTQLKARIAAFRRGRWLALLLTGLALALAAALQYVLRHSIADPVRLAVEGLGALSSKNLAHRVTGEDGGEMGRIFAAINLTSDEMSHALRTIHQTASRLGEQSGVANDVSCQLSAAAEETFSQASVVSSSAEQVSQNAETVAASIEELTASIREISGNATEAATMAQSAVGISDRTTQSVGELRSSSGEIDQVVQVIQSIAEQTNLLALNATIEAARAGEAGKGFAVVAQAVKELSRETASATEDIGRKIEAIQDDTREAISGIEEISGMVAKISDYQHSIASAVEQQTVTTREIGQNVSEAAAGSREIAENITAVAAAAQETAEGASSARAAANQFNELADELRHLVQEFRLAEETKPPV